MTNYIKIDHKNKKLVYDRTFAKNSSIVGSKEYYLLQQARKDYPDYTPEQKKIKKNANKTTYGGLDYDYMRTYINRFGKDVEAELKEFDDMIFLSKCHKKSLRYPTIKKWFLAKYPEVKNFLNPTEEKESEKPQFEVMASEQAELGETA
ncbi:MAG: hypothetical protein IJN77_06160 [Oscillospiraceae bacterium]|nr:hypothetical protein [Oscillospiraceae bacterium]